MLQISAGQQPPQHVSYDDPLAHGVLLQKLLPGLQRFILTEGIQKGSIKGCGSYAEVYDGTFSTSWMSEKKRIAIKRIRVVLYKEQTDFIKVR